MYLGLESRATEMAYYWPGLAIAWHRGAARGLFISVVYAWWICLLLLATFVWPEWFSVALVRGMWLLAFVVWLGTTIYSRFTMRSYRVSCDDSGEFEKAQEEYLRGNWFEAEALLLRILERQPEDVPAALLLIGILRHTQRWQPALRRIEQVKLLDSAAVWTFEVEQEKRLVLRAIQNAGSADGDESQDENFGETEVAPTQVSS